MAENLGVKVGDTVTLTDPDMRQLTVEVSGIYHNSVYNYAIVEPETIEAQWGSLPGSQMAFVRVEDYCDHHEVGAFAAEQSGVSVEQLLEGVHIGVLKAKGMSEAELARAVGSSPQAFNQRMKTGKFSTEEMDKIAAALEADYYFGFEFKDGTKI